MITAKQAKLLEFIAGFIKREGCGPSLEEMRVAIGAGTRSEIHRLLAALEHRGFIRRIPKHARSIEVLRQLRPPAADPGPVTPEEVALALNRWWQHPGSSEAAADSDTTAGMRAVLEGFLGGRS